MKSRSFVLVVLSLLFIAPTASSAEWAEFTREELFSTFFEEVPNADAVVLLDHGVVRVDDKFRLKFTRHRRVKIFTEAGAARSQIRLPYRAGTEMKDFRAHTFIPPEKKVKVKGEHIREEQTADGTVRIVTFPEVQPGAILELSYEIRCKQLDVVSPWRFQTGHYTRESRLDLQLPDGLSHRAFFGWTASAPPRSTTTRVNDPQKPERRLTQTTWTAASLPALRREPMTPNSADHCLTLYVQLERYRTTYKSFEIERPWADLASPIATGFEDAWRANAKAAAWAGASVDGIRDPEGKARALYLRVRDGIRSEAPANFPLESVPSLVDALSAEAGSPIAKNLILTQLLRIHGFDASPVLVTTRDRGTFHPQWRTTSQLNHAIVAVRVDAETVFADASMAHCPFGVLAPSAAVGEGILVGPQGGVVVPVSSRPIDSSRNVFTSAELDPKGDLVVKSTWTLAGHLAFEARRALGETGALALVERVIGARFADATVASVGLTGEDDGDAPLGIATTFRVPGWATKKGYDLSCGAPFVFAGDDNPLGTEERLVPVTFDYSWTSEESLALRVPRGLYVPAPPAEAGTRTPEVSFSLRYDAKGTTLEGKRRFRVREPVVEESGVGQLQDLYGQLALADRAQFTVKRQPMRGSSPSSTK